MRIGIIANFGLGLIKFRKEIIESLLQRGHEVYIFYPTDEFEDELSVLGCEVINVDMNRHGMNPLEDIRLFFDLRTKLKESHIEIVFTYTIKPNIYGGMAAKSLKIPYIPNITGLGTMFETDNYSRRMISVMYKFSLSKAKHVFFQNEHNLNIFRSNNLLQSDYSIIPGSGVNLINYEELPYPNNDKTVFLYIGRIMRSKGIIELLEAVNNVGRNDFVLKIVGLYDDDIEETVKEQILRSNGKVIYCGYQTNTIPFISSCDALINPSHHEGMSNVLLEGAASGRPLLASNIPGCKEIVSKINGFLFEVKNAKSIEKKLNKFLELPLSERMIMGRNSRKHIVDNFDRKLIVNKIINIAEEKGYE